MLDFPAASEPTVKGRTQTLGHVVRAGADYAAGTLWVETTTHGITAALSDEPGTFETPQPGDLAVLNPSLDTVGFGPRAQAMRWYEVRRATNVLHELTESPQHAGLTMGVVSLATVVLLLIMGLVYGKALWLLFNAGDFGVESLASLATTGLASVLLGRWAISLRVWTVRPTLGVQAK